MRKADIITKVSSQTGVDRSDVQEVVEATIATIKKTLIDGDSLFIRGFGTFSNKKDAEKQSLELGCIGIHKNQNKWLPCENEKELHRYLRK